MYKHNTYSSLYGYRVIEPGVRDVAKMFLLFIEG